MKKGLQQQRHLLLLLPRLLTIHGLGFLELGRFTFVLLGSRASAFLRWRCKVEEKVMYRECNLQIGYPEIFRN